MDDVQRCEHDLERYGRRWKQIGAFPWIPALLIELYLLVSGRWEEALRADLFSHALLFLPILAWSVGRRELRKSLGPVVAAPRPMQRTEAQGYRTAAEVEGAGEAWIVTRHFPRWVLVTAASYLLIDVALYGLAALVPYLGFWLALVFIIPARLCFFYFGWFTFLYRDGSRAAVLERRPAGSSTEIILRCRHRQGPWLASIARLDDDPSKLHLEILGAVEHWTVAWPTDRAYLGRALAEMTRAQAERRAREREENTCRA